MKTIRGWRRTATAARACLRLSLAAVAATPWVGCYASSATVSAGVRLPGPPTMVLVSPGVWAVEDYDYPVYFSDGFYWSLQAGAWYRSPYWDREFVPYPRDRVPVHIAQLRHEDYRHYRAPTEVERVRPGRGEQPSFHPMHEARGERR